MMNMQRMKGRFDYRNRGIAIPHFLPINAFYDDMPVIVFPQNNTEIVPEKYYEFFVKMTRKATYVIDDVVYRVGHAIGLKETEETSADYFDRDFHSHAGDQSPTTLGDTKAGKLLAALRG